MKIGIEAQRIFRKNKHGMDYVVLQEILQLPKIDHKNEYYTYLVDRNGTVNEAVDPYAKGVGANGNRGMVVDLDSTDPDGWDTDEHVLFDNPGEAVVWEVHVRDFSIDVSSGVSEANRGKYLAFTEGNTTVNGEGKIATCVVCRGI